MKLSQLTAKPQLVEFKIEDEDTITKYGEAITFHTYDRQPLDVFMRLASATEGKTQDIISIVKDLILDEAGKPIISGENMLPTDVLMKAIALITQKLGG
jgi:hypothetical protein